MGVGSPERDGVEAYGVCDADPSRRELSGFLRRGDELSEIQTMNGHVSPRLMVKFETREGGPRIIRLDGRPFLTRLEMLQQREQERQRGEQEKQRADEQHSRAGGRRGRSQLTSRERKRVGLHYKTRSLTVAAR